jgi:UDP:flavonoid glycosyltransferase YjiC (YdhE family)
MYYVIPVVSGNGDALPSVMLGNALRARGHRVSVIASVCHAELVAGNGLDFVALSDSDAYAKSLRDRPVLAGRYQSLFFARHCISWNCFIYNYLKAAATKELRVVAIDRPNLWADLIAFDELKIPACRVEVDLPAPFLRLRSEALPPSRIQKMLAVKWHVEWQKAAYAQCGLRVGLNHVQRLARRVRGLVPTIALWPDWMKPEKRFGHLRAFGFPVIPECIPVHWRTMVYGNTLEPHIVFCVGTDGTAGSWLREFVHVSGKICEKLGIKGLLLTGRESFALNDSTGWLQVMPFSPLDDVLTDAVAIVHHGGIGTATAALRRAVPQLIIPRMFAQGRNAEWFRQLGVCRVLQPDEYAVCTGVGELRRLLTKTEYRDAAIKMRDRPGFDVNIDKICRYLEML